MSQSDKMLVWWVCPTCGHNEHWSYAAMIDQGAPVCPHCDTDMIPDREDN